MKADVLALSGDTQKQIELHDKVFFCEASKGSIYHAVRNELANRRVGTASTRNRADIRGSNRKPWRQKGLGRARAGTRRSPLWKGGGIIFGPQPRDYSYHPPKNLRRLAMRSLLSWKLKENKLIIVEDFTVESAKTRDFIQKVSPLFGDEKPMQVVLVMKDNDPDIKRATANIPWLRLLHYSRLSAHTLLYARRIIVMETAALSLCDFYAGGKNDT